MHRLPQLLMYLHAHIQRAGVVDRTLHVHASKCLLPGNWVCESALDRYSSGAEPHVHCFSLHFAIVVQPRILVKVSK